MTNPCQGHAAESARAEYLKEAERLMRHYTTAVLEQNYEAIALYHFTLLAHIQRGAVPEGWQPVPKEPTDAMLGAGIRHTDGMASMPSAYRAMLAAAPAPDQFRDAAGMMPAPAEVLGKTCVDGGKCHHACTDRCFRRECCVPFSDHTGPWSYAPAASALPERDTTRPAKDQGLFRKFDVRRVDGSDAPGRKHHGCEYFVLDLNHDPHVPAALLAYAQDCAATHPELSADLIRRYGLRASAPAEVPMPEPVERAMVKVIDTSADVVCASDEWNKENDANFKRLLKRSKDAQAELRATVQQYGDAREAAGYARGLAEAGRDAEAFRAAVRLGLCVNCYTSADCIADGSAAVEIYASEIADSIHVKAIPDPYAAARSAVFAAANQIDALRGEVK